MMFRRRHKLHPLRYLREFVWPRAGWHRTSRYLMHRLSRLPESPYSIAAGFACGAAMSVTPFVGFHFMLAALIAWLIGGNILAAAFGTAVGNPWTFPFIWYWVFQFGNWILGANAGSDLPDQLTLGYMWDHPALVLFPMTVGSIPTAIMAWAVAYWPVCELVEGYQSRRRKRLARAGFGGGPQATDRRTWMRRAEDREDAERTVGDRRVADRRAADTTPADTTPADTTPVEEPAGDRRAGTR